ncbi:MAG: conserved hypothetical rane protein [Actinomycetia bacterium]|nr:conserved hypothetical rane protein [Actinomycetes bacterium]
MNSDIGWSGLGISAALVAIALGISAWQHLGVERTLLWSSLRAAVQLVLVGVALHFVLAAHRSIGWSWLWLAAMVGFASLTVWLRARDVPGLLPLALFAFTVSLAVTLGVLLGLQVFPTDARTLVPLSGLIVGNSLAATVLVGRRVYEELRDKRGEVEARLALGQSARDAAQPYVRSAIRSALIPQIETTKAVGIIFLPGAMTGLILAGVDPLNAVRVQIAVMYVVLASVATTTSIVGLGVARRLFTSDHRVVRLTRKAE